MSTTVNAADVWCKSKSGSVFVRDLECKKTEVKIDLLASGLQGPIGAKGSPGVPGSSGKDGKDGKDGEDGIVSTLSFAGATSPTTFPIGEKLLLSPYVTVSITSENQKITGVALLGIGGSATSPWQGYVIYDLCYRDETGQISYFSPKEAGNNFANTSGAQLNQAPGEQTPVTVANSVTNLSPGTYNIGFCLQNGINNTVSISNNDYLTGWFIITN